MEEEKKDIGWLDWPNHFGNISHLDQINYENLIEVINKYKKVQRLEMWVKHKHIGSDGKVKYFAISPSGHIEYVKVWRKGGGYGFWESKKCKLINRPSEKPRKPKFDKSKIKVKKQGEAKIEKCEEHPSYTGQRRPRTGCKVCMKVYESNHSRKQDSKKNKDQHPKNTKNTNRRGRPRKNK